ncbi:5-methyltetrahydropteroyltriglutamate--homocysteine S-methyltransferase [Candidatus Termititenax persephonae]|uniref:5-methyltetrahydropteroyltriglutamate--homocysteine methyltransferase n=1 Tax=Candidatus Termititenax persephonae TaxID=2218525 RepID=A0A388TI82_9BACT|nr:5-methyltetrahydropteroyltriglutamate--homocysteine S-methyltransferase [Candidatus Termititenax persephonae]
MQTTIVGYPRLGAQRELKKYTEQYFRGEITQAELLQSAAKLREAQWLLQKQKGLAISPVNDFSFYDNLLDMAFLLKVIPARYQELGLSALDTYFAMARGYQDSSGSAGQNVRALKMRKWFNTNYHYLVPEIEGGIGSEIQADKLWQECSAAEKLGLNYRPALIGPYTFLRLSLNKSAQSLDTLAAELAAAYGAILTGLARYSCEYVQLDEPALVLDLTADDSALFEQIYLPLLAQKRGQKILLQTYFGDIRDIYAKVSGLGFDALGLDLVEGGRGNLELLEKYGFPADKKLYAGLVNGKNIWLNDYQKSLAVLGRLDKLLPRERLVLSTSCSLLHVPYSVRYERKLAEKYKRRLAFAEEKLAELSALKMLAENPDPAILQRNQEIIWAGQNDPDFLNRQVREQARQAAAAEIARQPIFAARQPEQQKQLNLPWLPTTTIGSFPQTAEVRAWRKAYKQGQLTAAEYQERLKGKIKEVIARQEELGLDVLVHGEYERNDMVEYFGEHLQGFVFTENGWVQSYGTRGVKPPLIFGDVARPAAFTVEWIKYAQSLTARPVKGMLTGPITILNWSFPREDIPLAEIAYQIALAIQAEVLDLEKNGIKIIQIDEAALREKLPLRRADWQRDYLAWAVKAFRLTHYLVKPETQIHTHMCYSELADISATLKALDADVLTVEAARSDWTLLAALADYDKYIGPGIYDVHSPRVPAVEELAGILEKMCAQLAADQLWVNPDCGLKTRAEAETTASLRNLVAAAVLVREKISLPFSPKQVK